MNDITLIDCCEDVNEDIKEIKSYLHNYLQSKNIELKELDIRDMKIVSCTHCHCCAQTQSHSPIKCFLHDEMDSVIDDIEDTTSYIILSDTHSILDHNKVYDKFSERLVAYYYWPYGSKDFQLRKTTLDKKSVLINYNTSKFFCEKSFSISKDHLNDSSNAIGAKVIDALMIKPTKNIIDDYKEKLEKLCLELIK